MPHPPPVRGQWMCVACPVVKIADEGERVRARCPFSIPDPRYAFTFATVEPEISVSLGYFAEYTPGLFNLRSEPVDSARIAFAIGRRKVSVRNRF